MYLMLRGDLPESGKFLSQIQINEGSMVLKVMGKGIEIHTLR